MNNDEEPNPEDEDDSTEMTPEEALAETEKEALKEEASDIAQSAFSDHMQT